MNLLGISAFYHDSAAAVIVDGNIAAAAQEERFSRIKHDNSFPEQSIEFCLSQAGLTIEDIDHVVYYEDPELKLDRVKKTMSSFPVSFSFFKKNMKSQKKKNDFLNKRLVDYKHVKHHEAHAAAAFYPSPYNNSAIVTLDGVGEWDTVTIAVGIGNRIKILKSLKFPDSIGLLYSSFTQYCGFKVNFGEYKLMGLAPYGRPLYYDLIMNRVLDLRSDGSFSLNLDYFDFCTGSNMINERFENLFGAPQRKSESKITKKYCDVAASIQKVIEEIVYRVCAHAKEITGMKNLCLAGGVALNCVSNGRIKESGLFEDMWIQPAAGDSGNALGAPLYYYYNTLNNERRVQVPDSMQNAFLGPKFDNSDIRKFLDSQNTKYEYYDDEELLSITADKIADGQVIGWFQGRMEFGPRALGHRSILGDPRSPKMQSKMNMKIKFRESFRPFAPCVLEEDVGEYFKLSSPSPYMLLVSEVNKKYLKNNKEKDLDIHEQVKLERSVLPAITHVDNSARIQTVNKEQNNMLYQLLKKFKKITNFGILINTSFNVRGEPIVRTPNDAWNCFMLTDMDCLVIGNFVLDKKNQSSWSDKIKNQYLERFELD